MVEKGREIILKKGDKINDIRLLPDDQNLLKYISNANFDRYVKTFQPLDQLQIMCRG